MPSYTVDNAAFYPNGTVVYAYSRADIPIGHSGAPIGTAIDSGTMTAGSVSFQGLDVGEYVAAGLVAGAWRYLDFSIDRIPRLALYTDSPDPAAIAGAWRFVKALQFGYNPSVELFPDDTKRWGAIDGIIITEDEFNKARAFFRSLNLSDASDPPELVFWRTGSESGHYGPNGDGTDLAGGHIGMSMGRMKWVAMNQNESFQEESASVAANLSEDARRDVLEVTLANEVTLPQSTIQITGNLDEWEAEDGSTHAFAKAGTVRLGAETVTYSGRSQTKLFGCEGGTGTFAAGTILSQVRSATGGSLILRTAQARSSLQVDRFTILADGSAVLGEDALAANPTNFFEIAGGTTRFQAVREPANLTATVVGTPGTATITYYIVGRAVNGVRTNAVSVTINNAPNTLNETNYVNLVWDRLKGIHSWDVIRESTTGLPAATGPIILGQSSYGTSGKGQAVGRAVDIGQALVAANETQSIEIRDADGGTFTLTFDGQMTSDISWATGAALITAIDNALEALSNIGAGDVTTTALADNVVLVEFTGALAGTDVAQMSSDAAGLTQSDPELFEGLPLIKIRTRTVGGPTSYAKPTRNETADIVVDGEATVSQALLLPERSTDPDAPSATIGKLYAKDSGGRTKAYLRDSTGVKGLLDTTDIASTWNLAGTHAARPAAGTAGRTYFETDTHILYRDSGSAWQATGPGYIHKAATEVVNNSTTLQNDNELFFPIEVGEVWQVELFLNLNAPNDVPDWKFDWSLPTGVVGIHGAQGIPAEGASFPFLSVAPAATPNAAVSIGTPLTIGGTSGGTREAILHAEIRATGGTATAGPCNFQWAQNTLNANDSSVQLRSWMRLTRVLGP